MILRQKKTVNPFNKNAQHYDPPPLKMLNFTIKKILEFGSGLVTQRQGGNNQISGLTPIDTREVRCRESERDVNEIAGISLSPARTGHGANAFVVNLQLSM